MPVQEAPHLRVGLPVHLVDDAGRLALHREAVLRLALGGRGDPVGAGQGEPRASRAASGPSSSSARGSCGRETPALTVPFVAVNRVNGQYFAFVAESGEGGKTVARQRAVELGAVVGNDYVVRSGLKAGEKLIVSGVQKIADGAPVQITAPQAPASPAAPGGKGE